MTSKSPVDDAGFLSRITFDYGRPLLRKGALAPLQERDLPPLAADDNVGNNIAKLELTWENEIKRAKKADTKPEFVRALFAAFRNDFLAGSFLSLIEDGIILAQVMLLRPFLAFIASDRPDGDGYFLAGMIAFASMMQAVIHHQNFLISMKVGWKLRISVTGLLHKKLLKVSQEALGHQDSASVYNLIASDVQRFDNVMPMLHLGYWGFLGSIVIIYLLSVEVGAPSAFAGTGTIVVYVAVQIKFARQFGLRRRITAKITDMRVRLTSEMLNGISSVKAYAWEGAFLDKLSGLRLMEHNSIFVSQSMKACTGALYFATPAIASLATFTTYTYGTNHELDVDRVYNTIALINTMRLFIGAHLGRFLEFGPECYVATQRMQNFLLLPNAKPRKFTAKLDSYASFLSSMSSTDSLQQVPLDSSLVLSKKKQGNNAGSEGVIVAKTDSNKVRDQPIVVNMNQACFGRDNVVAIENIDLCIAKGELVLIAGPVGCGKSTLLEGLLGEVELMSGDSVLKGAVAYSPQEAWIMAGSLEQNILFGEPLDKQRLEKVIDVCALATDIEQLPDGLDTEIGEKGVNLSGGQRARVSLARACYAKADVVLLDDPLSAVDPSVAKHIFHNCIVDWLTKQQGAAVILVTHQRQFMPNVNRIVLMDGGDVALRKHRQSLLKLSNEKVKLNNKLKEQYKLHDDICNKIHDFGVECVLDLKDPHLINLNTLSNDMGIDREEAIRLLNAIENDDDDELEEKKGIDVTSSTSKRNSSKISVKSAKSSSSQNVMDGNARLPGVVMSELSLDDDSHNPLSLFSNDDEEDDVSLDGNGTLNSTDVKHVITIESLDEEGLMLVDSDRHSLMIHDNDDHNTTCGRIVAQGNFNQLIGVGYVTHDTFHGKRKPSIGIGGDLSVKLDGGEDELKEDLEKKIEEEANAMIEQLIKEKDLLDEEVIDLKDTDMDKNAPSFTMEKNAKTPSAFTQLVGAEDREVGLVSLKTWIAYVKASGNVLAFLVCLLFIAGQVLLLLGDWWLVVWASANNQDRPYYVMVFLFLTLSTVAASFLRAMFFFYATLRASSNLHRLAAERLFSSPLSFFAATPMGRVLNRFSADLTVVDEQLSVALFETMQLACITASGLVVACVILPIATAVIPPVIGTMLWLRQYTTASMRELKRMDGTTRSPCYTAFRAATVGLTCIRAYGKADKAHVQFVDRLRRNAVTWYWWLITNRWFGFWLDILVFVVVLATTMTAVGMRKVIEPGLIGLALVYVLGLSGLFQYMMRQSAMVETFMTSVERINHYAFNLELEEDSLKKALNTSVASTTYSPSLSPAQSLTFYIKQSSGILEPMRMKLPKQKMTQENLENDPKSSLPITYSPSLPPRRRSRSRSRSPAASRNKSMLSDSSSPLPSSTVTISQRAEIDHDTEEEGTTPKLNYFVKQPSGDLEKMKLKLSEKRNGSFSSRPPRGHSRSRSRSRSRSPARLESSSHHSESKTWPVRGNVELRELTLRYRHDLPEVVKGISVKLQGGSKVGVVGRTGSGKSSLLLALSRLNEICGGQVMIDGRDTTDMPLSELREAISVIPQEPHLFSGTIRFNLDPFQRYDDHAVWNALEETKLKSFVTECGGLDGTVSEGGGNWSTGQRQLLSIARALLHRRKIVLLDEATASVDFENDQAIQRMLRTSSAFKEATLIVIAHRIDTIIDSDLVLVLDNGKLVEQGNPQDLVNMKDGIFATMVAASRRKNQATH